MRKAGEDALKSVSWASHEDDFGSANVMFVQPKNRRKSVSNKWSAQLRLSIFVVGAVSSWGLVAFIAL